jgi:hypothetical protein
MLIALLTALIVSGTGSPTPAPSNSSAPATVATATLREVVYHVTFTRRMEVSSETYGGSIGNPVTTDVTQAPAFNHANGDASDNGTVTVDVMQIADDSLGLRVTEHWNNGTPSGTYLGNVAADGTVNFKDGQLNECTREILEYFGADVMADQPANEGVTWTRIAKGQSADVTTVYTVGAIDGAIANIHEVSTVTTKSVAVLDSLVTVDVQYKPAMLAPISGRVVVHASQSGPSSMVNVTTVDNFQRVSDTRDAGP